MGCDIHGMFERYNGFYWINEGDPAIGRNYTIFSILADVRNEDGIPAISPPRFSYEEIINGGYDTSTAYNALAQYWDKVFSKGSKEFRHYCYWH